jgi:hypothetical protein
MDLPKTQFNEKISDPITPRHVAAVLGSAYTIPTVALFQLAKGRPITPWTVLGAGLLGAGVGLGVNEINRRYFLNEFDEWRKGKNGTIY